MPGCDTFSAGVASAIGGQGAATEARANGSSALSGRLAPSPTNDASGVLLTESGSKWNELPTSFEPVGAHHNGCCCQQALNGSRLARSATETQDSAENHVHL